MIREATPEEWRPIPGHPLYEASTHGRIRRVAGLVPTRRGYFTTVRSRVLKPECGKRPSDYPRVYLSQHDIGTRQMVHCLIARTFIGECPPGYEHNHKDGNKRNPRPENLEFVTRSQNEHHKRDVLRVKVNQGARHGMAKLTDTDVIAIHARCAKGDTQRSVAAAFGVSEMTVSQIVNRRTWRHLSLPHLHEPVR